MLYISYIWVYKEHMFFILLLGASKTDKSKRMMTTNQILIKEFQFINNWTQGLVETLNENQWNETLPEIRTNISWIIGHIVHNNYWHSIGWVKPASNKFLNDFDIDYLDKFFKKDSNPLLYIEERPSKKEILTLMNLLKEETIKNIKELSPEELEQKTLSPSPVAKTKYESLSFAIKHQMWHNGQIAMIKRILKN
ncbi:DinB family protein [Flavivirga eckloniae]|uniref:DinB-like domain-containing protein n=1 Tax=Flavivirga eckloniae TaxID=1803846 RepID=A0A2K9PWS5_9FLAO|nr:DinB family protein [Flavivirga eckloniae]AUP81298.1 hypothetical protein C1H87_22290 [Flavivirga eckloniae]